MEQNKTVLYSWGWRVLPICIQWGMHLTCWRQILHIFHKYIFFLSFYVYLNMLILFPEKKGNGLFVQSNDFVIQLTIILEILQTGLQNYAVVKVGHLISTCYSRRVYFWDFQCTQNFHEWLPPCFREWELLHLYDEDDSMCYQFYFFILLTSEVAVCATLCGNRWWYFLVCQCTLRLYIYHKFLMVTNL